VNRLPPGDRYAHGTRARYIAGRCRCDDCRAANAAFERERKVARRGGDWNGLVAAERARQHLLALREGGIGRRTVSDITGLSGTIVSMIASGKKRQIRARTERDILAIGLDVVNDATLVDAAPAWARVAQLQAWGLSKAEIARRLGRKAPALQMRRDQITARTARLVEELHRAVDEARTAPAESSTPRVASAAPDLGLVGEPSDAAPKVVHVHRDLERRVVGALRDRESSTVDELADDCAAPAARVLQVLERLERAGWAAREVGDVDVELAIADVDVWWLTD
jgi:hypothetical protein